MSELCFDVCIIGGGPAAHSAAIYTTRAKLSTVMFEGGSEEAGGQLTQTTMVENFPGFPDGVMGFDLVEKFRSQSLKWGADIRSFMADQIQLVQQAPNLYRVFYDHNSKTILARSIILASGSTGKRLHFPNADKFWNRGITGCAVCHGGLPLFRNKRLFVVGGGDSAMEDAIYLTKFASEVVIIHRRNSFRASKIMQERVFANPKIKILWDCEVVQADGDATSLRTITVRHLTDSTLHTYEAGGMFYAIGHTPNTQLVANLAQLDDEGYIVTDYLSSRTNVPGLFAAGDVCAVDKKYKQAIVAAGSGCKAGMDVIDYMS